MYCGWRKRPRPQPHTPVKDSRGESRQALDTSAGCLPPHEEHVPEPSNLGRCPPLRENLPGAQREPKRESRNGVLLIRKEAVVLGATIEGLEFPCEQESQHRTRILRLSCERQGKSKTTVRASTRGHQGQPGIETTSET